jgi:gamma-glutamylcyclotransferase (GGCT)/AIG2-like uncharacterized protein YtfP
MKQKCLLFAYGTLQPGFSPPKSVSAAWPDRVKGELYDLGEYPVAVKIEDGTEWIEGHTLELDADELPTLDEYEDVEGGEFARRLTETEAGHVVWVYEYVREVPEGLEAMRRWR